MAFIRLFIVYVLCLKRWFKPITALHNSGRLGENKVSLKISNYYVNIISERWNGLFQNVCMANKHEARFYSDDDKMALL